MNRVAELLRCRAKLPESLRALGVTEIVVFILTNSYMVTIKNKYLLAAISFWVGGIVLLLLGALLKAHSWAGTLLAIGITAQAIGFGFFGYVLMQAAFTKKK